MNRHVLPVALTLIVLSALVAAPVRADDDPAALYKARCAACHGADGSGDTAMGKKLNVKPLGSAEVQKQRDPELQAVIVDGRGKMPGFGKKLDQEQVAALVKLVRGFSKK